MPDNHLPLTAPLAVLPLSKSLLNRWMILVSLNPSLWDSLSEWLREAAERSGEDTRHLFEALQTLNQTERFPPVSPPEKHLVLNCGEGGAPFRFLALRASRSPGKYQITGTPRLLSRPMTELMELLPALGVKVRWDSTEGLFIESQGWTRARDSQPLFVSRARSSQFLSAVVLASFGWKETLEIESPQEGALSDPYAEMSLSILKSLGAEVSGALQQGRISVNSRAAETEPDSSERLRKLLHENLESDWSAAWSIAAHAACGSHRSVSLTGLRLPSLQADSVFPEILQRMGVRCSWNSSGVLQVTGTDCLQGVSQDLTNSPDLFPVLMALVIQAQTPSVLTGLESLRYKESDRLERMVEWAKKCGAQVRELEAGIEVHPSVSSKNNVQKLGVFDPDQDHRLAMAASVLQTGGFSLTVSHPEVVSKSFPQFWSEVNRMFVSSAQSNQSRFVFLVGQRGVGKSSLLKRLKKAWNQDTSSVAFLDLDQEIQARSGLPIEMIFQQEGEAGFRQRERVTLEDLIREKDAQTASLTVIALGAGFEADHLEVFSRPETQVIWIKRVSDSHGRIFLDRPRLNPEMPPLEEYLTRAAFRARRFERLATSVHELEEGAGNFSEDGESWEWGENHEKAFFERLLSDPPSGKKDRSFFQAGSSSAIQTWMGKGDAGKFAKQFLREGGDGVEVRTDLLDSSVSWGPDQWAKWGDTPVLFSWRGKTEVNPQSIPSHWIQDWALELGEIPSSLTPRVISLHDRKEGESLVTALDRLVSASQTADQVLKAAPEIRDFEELWEGHQWRMKDPNRRVFLPRTMHSSSVFSLSGKGSRWKFYRLWTAKTQRMEFVRGITASALDQPTLLERNRVKHALAPFGAVVGDPVSHSQSPVFHRAFFQSRGREYFAIPIPFLGSSADEADLHFAKAMEVLSLLGAQCFSVTSPWKESAYRLLLKTSGTLCPRAQRLASVNTLFCETDSGSQSVRWQGDNTDLPGFRASAREVARRLGLREHRTLEEVAVWGGGGTLPIVKEEFPVAAYFSAKTGEFRGVKPALYDSASEFRPRIIVWAVSRGRIESGAKFPPREWHPDWVVDLNYSEDSPGREVAQRMGARYLSGMTLFKTQGLEQQMFWNECLKDQHKSS